MTRWVGVLALSFLSAAHAPALPGQATAVRFEISAVGDSTFSFRVGRQRWVAPHLTGIAVDPRRRDALVARYEVLGVAGGVATALVTGETTRLTMEHVALLQRPTRAWYQDPLLWSGTAFGVVLGAFLSR